MSTAFTIDVILFLAWPLLLTLDPLADTCISPQQFPLSVFPRLVCPSARLGQISWSSRFLWLSELARQAGVAANAVRLTTDLQRLTQDLQQTRERLVAAREEERRRLRRDLHDGLGPQLSSQTLLLTSAQMLLRQDPDEVEAILKSAITQSQQAIRDIRRLVYALRPPSMILACSHPSGSNLYSIGPAASSSHWRPRNSFPRCQRRSRWLAIALYRKR